jgi:hypothetical protein
MTWMPVRHYRKFPVWLLVLDCGHTFTRTGGVAPSPDVFCPPCRWWRGVLRGCVLEVPHA